MNAGPTDKKNPSADNEPEENPEGLPQSTNDPDADPDKERVEKGEPLA